MEFFNKLILCIVLFSPKPSLGQECESLIKKYNNDVEGTIIQYSAPPIIKDYNNFININTISKNIGLVYITLLINEFDKVVCYNILDKTKLEFNYEIKKYIDGLKVESPRLNEKKVFGIMTIRLNFVSSDLIKKNKKKCNFFKNLKP
jgi:hypothetical protein